jgi:hypothetical protein
MAHAQKPTATNSNSKRTGAFVRSFESTIMNESFAGNAGTRNQEKWLTKEKACLLLSEGTLFFY